MKEVKQKTFNKQVAEGRVEVAWEISEDHHYKTVECYGKNGKPNYIVRIVKEN